MILQADFITVDMIDVTIELNSYEFDLAIQPLISTYRLDIRLKYWESFKWNNYRHNWHWETDEYSFFFAYSLNINEDLKTRFRLSYNPNKVSSDDRVLSYLLNVLKAFNPIVRSIDVAFDYMGVTTSDLTFDKGRKKEYKIMKYPNSDLTYYLGSGDGRVKVYDKASEESEEKAEYNKTRYEVTVDVNTLADEICEWTCKTELPPFYIQMELADIEFNPTDKLLLYSVKHGFPMDKLTYRQRKRYEMLLESVNYTYTKIQPSQFAVEKAVKQFVNDLFH